MKLLIAITDCALVLKQSLRGRLRIVVIASTLLLFSGSSFPQSINSEGIDGGIHSLDFGFQGETPDLKQPKSSDIHFKLIMSGRLGMKGADSVEFGNYRADDGTLAQRRHESYHSSSQAIERMQEMIDTAKRVVDRGAVGNKIEKNESERVILITKNSDAVVVRREGSSLYLLQSKKLNYALALEEQTNHSHQK